MNFGPSQSSQGLNPDFLGTDMSKLHLNKREILLKKIDLSQNKEQRFPTHVEGTVNRETVRILSLLGVGTMEKMWSSLGSTNSVTILYRRLK